MLELACGDGLTALSLSNYGLSVVACDMDDYRDEKAKSLDFVCSKIENGLPLADDTFDAIYSYEAFEHVEDPAKCFKEIERLCRPGGIVYLNFGPLFASALGLHAFGTSTCRTPSSCSLRNSLLRR